mgnify:CR=1 FL=1
MTKSQRRRQACRAGDVYFSWVRPPAAVARRRFGSGRSWLHLRFPHGLLGADARVDLLVDRLCDDAAQNDERTGEQAQQHQQVIVLVSRALIGQRAEAGVGKHGFDNVRPAQHVRDGDGHDA